MRTGEVPESRVPFEEGRLTPASRPGTHREGEEAVYQINPRAVSKFLMLLGFFQILALGVGA
jgi:hypothetical protein